MNNALEIFIVVFSLVFIVTVALLILLSRVKKKINSKVIDSIWSILIQTLLIYMMILLVGLFILAYVFSLCVVYSLIRLPTKLVLMDSISIYLSLLGTIIFSVYFPDRIGYSFLKLMGRATKTNEWIANVYPLFIKLIRPKFWAYLFAFTITFISSLETISGKSVVSLRAWLEMKPYILQSVVAFIAFDRMIVFLRSQLQGIKEEMGIIRKYISNEGANNASDDVG